MRPRAAVVEIAAAAAAIAFFAWLGSATGWCMQKGTIFFEPVWPFYTAPPTPRPYWSARVLFSLAAGVVAWFGARRWLRSEGEVVASLVGLVGGAYLWHLAIGIQAHGLELGFRYTFSRGMEYWWDVRYVHTGFLAAFPDVGRLSVHGATHPPGLTLLLYAVQKLGLTDMHDAELFCSVAPALSAFFVFGAARRLAGEELARWATALFLFACSVTAFAVLVMDTWTMLFSTVALYGFARALEGDVWGGLILGVGLATAALCSFLVLTLGGTFAVLVLSRWRTLERRHWVALWTGVAAFVGFYVVLWAAFGYRPIYVFVACARALRHSDDMHRPRWAPLVGAPAAFLGALGLPLMALGARAVAGAVRQLAAARKTLRIADPSTSALVGAAALPIVVCAVSGRPRGEFEHVFLLFVPMAVLAAAACARRWLGRDVRWLSDLALPVLMAQSIFIEIYMDPYW